MNFNIIILFVTFFIGLCHPQEYSESSELFKCHYYQNWVYEQDGYFEAYSEDGSNHDYYVAIDCGGIILIPGICDHLEDINKSNVEAVTFKNCEISDLSNIFRMFPNISKLAFLENNTLPSTDFSLVEHLSLFVNNDSKFKKIPSSSLSINGANLEIFQFNGTQNKDIDSISLVNLNNLEFFSLDNITILNDDLFKNSTNLVAVHLKSNKFESIESIVWPDSVKWLKFRSNKIDKLSKRSFEKLQKLEIAQLQENEIGDIENGTFSKLNKLYILWLNDNNIERITNETFDGLDRLENLHIENNRIQTVGAGAFVGAPHLHSLNLNGNKISSLNHKSFVGLNHLKSLSLASNSIRKIDIDLFVDLTKLLTLNMSLNELEAINFNAFAKTKLLNRLDLSNNKISRLEKMIPDTSKTEFSLPTIPKYINVVKWLKPIAEKGRTFLNKQTEVEMKFFIAAKRAFDFIEDRLVNIYAMKENLGVKINSKEVSHQLKELFLSNNKLTVIEKDIFAEFKDLKKLFLSKNPITTLYTESFAGLDKLNTLHMDHCALMSIDFSIFTHFKKLRKLNLSHNKLITFTSAPVHSIRILYLNNNQLTEFPAKHSDFRNLGQMYFKDNNSTCAALTETFRGVTVDCEPNNSNYDEESEEFEESVGLEGIF